MSILSLPSTTEDVIFDHLSAATLLKYGRTCKEIYYQVQSYARRRFRLHELLAPYFSPPQIDHLRQLQASTGMLISGSTALQFFDRAVFPESDLDLYVENARDSCEKIGRWLLNVGYTYRPHSSSSSASFADDLSQIQEGCREASPPAFIEPGPDDPAYHGQCVFTFGKGLESGRCQVQMIASKGPPLGSVLNFHSTCVMNILTHDTAYAFFPWATFEDRITLPLPDRKPRRNEAALTKYEKRGWTVRRCISRTHWDDPTFPFAPKLRHVGDAQCWRMPIFPLYQADQPCYHFESNSWRINYSNDLVLTTSYGVVASPCLQFSYLIDDGDEILMEQLEMEMGSELGDYETKDTRPPQLDNQLKAIIDGCRAGFLHQS